MSSPLKNRNGFSLVGILVGVSLLGILTVGMMQVFSNMMRGQNYNKFRSQVENFGEEFRTALSSHNVCTNTFTGITLNPATTTPPLTAIKNDAGTGNLYTLNTDLGDHSFKINEIKLVSTPSSPWYVEDNATTGTGHMILTVNYQATTEQSGPKDYYRTYTISTRRDSSGKLVDCASMAKMSDGIWRYNPATTADIYYSGGSVGIGTNTPNSTLQNSGSLAVNASTVTSTSYTITATDHVIIANPSAAATLTLPTAKNITGRIYTIKNNSTFAVTLSATAPENIDGSSSYVLSAQYQNVTLVSDGANWNIVSSIAQTTPSCGGCTNIVIASNAYNVNLFTLAGSPTNAGKWQFTINSGVLIGSLSPTTPALETGTFPAGSMVWIVNQGTIMGAGGAGGFGGGPVGPGLIGARLAQDGGPALSVHTPLTISNYGVITGGGGGGAGGG